MYYKQILIVVLSCLALSIAEPPKWRPNNRFTRLQRLEAPPAAIPPAAPAAPIPHTVYGPPTPAPSYGPPPSEYGPPKEEPSLTTTEISITTEVNSESVGQETNKTSKLQQKPTGSYYIYHPNGMLQKVTYLTNNDAKRMAFDVKLKYENVDPIKGPVYTYDPQTFVFQKLIGNVPH